MMIDILLGCFCALSFLPLMTGYCAYTHGRSFWLWFALGCFLPILSYLILFVLICRKQLNQGERLLDEAREILALSETKAR